MSGHCPWATRGEEGDDTGSSAIAPNTEYRGLLRSLLSSGNITD